MDTENPYTGEEDKCKLFAGTIRKFRRDHKMDKYFIIENKSSEHIQRVLNQWVSTGYSVTVEFFIPSPANNGNYTALVYRSEP